VVTGFTDFILLGKITLVIHWSRGFTLKSIHCKQHWVRGRNCHQMALWMS